MEPGLPFPPFLFPLFFVVLWGFVMLVLAKMGGWSKIAQLFAFSGSFAGDLYRFQSASFGFTNYGNCLNVGVNDIGLYMVPFFLFRSFHKPLFIPWNYICAEKRKVWLFERVRLTVTEVPGVHIDISKGLFQKMERFVTCS